MEHLRTWEKDGFKLILFYQGNEYLPYQLFDGDNLIFEGKDFRPSPISCIDSDESVYSLLGFLSLGIGDVEKEFFKDYTPFQIEWRESRRREDLSLLVYDFENPITVD